jgi:hypothetical protein
MRNRCWDIGVMLTPCGDSGVGYGIRIYGGRCRHLEDGLRGGFVGSREEAREVVIASFMWLLCFVQSDIGGGISWWLQRGGGQIRFGSFWHKQWVLRWRTL